MIDTKAAEDINTNCVAGDEADDEADDEPEEKDDNCKTPDRPEKNQTPDTPNRAVSHDDEVFPVKRRNLRRRLVYSESDNDSIITIHDTDSEPDAESTIPALERIAVREENEEIISLTDTDGLIDIPPDNSSDDSPTLSDETFIDDSDLPDDPLINPGDIFNGIMQAKHGELKKFTDTWFPI